MMGSLGWVTISPECWVPLIRTTKIITLNGKDKSVSNNYMTISVTNNGYLLHAAKQRDAYGNSTAEQSWTFESMSELQRRLPEILGAPYEKREKREKKCGCGCGD